MIGSLRGILRSKSPTEITLDVNGVGYVLSVSLSTSHQLGDVNETAHVLTHLHVREDALQLFGFADEQERHLFLLLISVSGIGPRTALGILSGTSPDELRAAISRKDFAALMTFPNIGRKTAERLVLELRDKIGDSEEVSRVKPPKDSAHKQRADALMALTALGFSRPVAEKAIRNVLNEDKSLNLTVEEIIKRALRQSDR